MATKKASKNTIRKTADTIKTKTKNINNTAIELTDSLVEGSITTGAKWQTIFAKAMKNSTTLFGKQQDMVLDTLEAVKEQYVDGGLRFRKLVEIDRINVKKATKAIKKRLNLDFVMDAATDTFETATETVKNVVNRTSKTNQKVKGTASKAKKKATSRQVTIDSLMEETNKTAKKVGKPVAKKVRKVTAKKATTKKVTPKKITAKKATNKKVVANDLKVIEGVGPKIEGLLNKAGILTFKQLSTTKVQDLKNILTAAGPRYKMHNPTTWKKQARLAANEKWNELIELQGQLKGGK